MQHESIFFTAKVAFAKTDSSSNAQNFVDYNVNILEVIKKHFKEPLANGFPEVKNEFKNAVVNLG